MQTLAERLIALRNAVGLSQAEVARRVGIKQPSLSRLESGGSHGSSHIAKFAALYRVNALWLSEGKGPRTASDSAASIEAQANAMARHPVSSCEVLRHIKGLADLLGLPFEAIIPDQEQAEMRITAALNSSFEGRKNNTTTNQETPS